LQANPLAEIDHRPWPIPRRPWMMTQVWRDLLFAHWSLPPAAIQHLVPHPLRLDTFEGQAWVSIAAFHMSLRLRGLPVLPGMADLPELNCRTYVTAEGKPFEAQGKPGIYFFSLDITSRSAVLGARSFYHLPYFRARMSIERHGDSFEYASSRGEARWRASYAPCTSSPPRRAPPGSLDCFLAERYCLYTVWREKTYRGDIHHAPWPLQDADVNIEENTIARAAGIDLPRSPHAVCFARELKVLLWTLERVA
jgi:uncharacterized protein